jgi:flavodoxin
MHTAVIYASRSGNTREVAEAIARVLGESGDSDVFPVESAPTDLNEFDLVVIGGPTEGHGMTPPMKSYLESIDPKMVKHRPVAAFDTRLAWPLLLSGSAAKGIASDLREMGALVAAHPESFIVSRKPELQPGELDHAARWAHQLAQAVEPRTSANGR